MALACLPCGASVALGSFSRFKFCHPLYDHWVHRSNEISCSERVKETSPLGLGYSRSLENIIKQANIEMEKYSQEQAIKVKLLVKTTLLIVQLPSKVQNIKLNFIFPGWSRSWGTDLFRHVKTQQSQNCLGLSGDGTTEKISKWDEIIEF